jgi:hypothetical protein
MGIHPLAVRPKQIVLRCYSGANTLWRGRATAENHATIPQSSFAPVPSTATDNRSTRMEECGLWLRGHYRRGLLVGAHLIVAMMRGEFL